MYPGTGDSRSPSRSSSTAQIMPIATDPVSPDPAKRPAISGSEHGEEAEYDLRQRKLRLKVDFRLCTIAALLASLQLLDNNIISSASVTSMLGDLGLDQGNRFSVAILIYTVSTTCFQLPATLAVRLLGPRIFFPAVTLGFGLITLCTAFIHTWRQMIIVRVLLGIFTSGIYPGLAILISSWYRREELQLRFAYLQVGQMVVLATGGIVNWALNLQIGGRGGLKGWQWWVPLRMSPRPALFTVCQAAFDELKNLTGCF